MHIRLAGVLSLCVVLWNPCSGHNIPEQLHKYDMNSHNMFVRENPTKKTIDELIREAMGDLKDTLNVQTKDDDILMELDMILSKQQYYGLYAQPKSSTLIRSKRKAVRNPFLRWPNGIIPYRFRLRHFSQRDQYMIRQAMTEWERYTCLRFREATSSDSDVVVFVNGKGCNSYVGMIRGEQEVSLASDGCRRIGVYLHEIGHAIGLKHEHNRPDRDKYVNIIWDNVDSNDWRNFINNTSWEVDQMNVPYDYYSVMHYSVTAYAKVKGLKTIIVKNPVNEARIGDPDTEQPSFRDIAIVNKMYECHAKCDPSIQCSGGYVDKNCQCVCENGDSDCQIGRAVKPSGECKNLHSDYRWCDILAKAGYCNTNWNVIIHCAKSCGTCSGPVMSTSNAGKLTNTIVKTKYEKPQINKVNQEANADDPNGIIFLD
ncbi:hypothetical protein ACJMK2_029849 [Sinanodonta woodiana]|uniref:Metalloendopeptidase n=1 Tax=Sinanodonta woodiana TaxID=1069815 RepID=A0ABD3XFG7_SINWO